MARFDPMALAKRQLARDRGRTRRFPFTLTRKGVRMRVSPLAFLRGAAPLFYDFLREDRSLADGPGGKGWLVGDLHLENFGAFVGQSEKHRRAATVFDLNDFDDAMIGPVRFDLLRLSTSFILAARELGANGVQALHMVAELLDAWVGHVIRAAPLPHPPVPVQGLIEQVRTRTRVDLLNARSQVVGGKRALIRGPRYADLPTVVSAALPKAFDGYIASLPKKTRPTAKQAEIIDAAFRIAGTGSLGVLRIGVLVRGKGGPDGAWIFDLKEQPTPSGAALGRGGDMPGAKRVLVGMKEMLLALPRLAGTTQLRGLSMLGRRLSPQEDKLDLSRIDNTHLPALARYLGALLGSAHRRGGAKVSARAWSASERQATIERVIRLAGMHEAVYLAFCLLTAGSDILPG